MALKAGFLRATDTGPRTGSSSGQALVETALVLPLALGVLGALLATGLWCLANLVGYAASSYSAWQGSALYREGLPDPQVIAGMADLAPSEESREVTWDGQWSLEPLEMERRAVEAANRWLDLLGGLASRRRVTVRTWRSVVVPQGDLRLAFTRYTMESVVEFDLPVLALRGQPLHVSRGTLTRVKEVSPYGSF